MMEKEAIERFVGKRVKIVQGSFVLTGVIKTAYDSSLFFKTERQEALISYNVITEIVTLMG